MSELVEWYLGSLWEYKPAGVRRVIEVLRGAQFVSLISAISVMTIH
jgi:hypothetical protein